MKAYNAVFAASIALATLLSQASAGLAPPADADASPLGWTPERAEKARLAGQRGLAYDYAADAEVALTPGAPVIRPGVQIVSAHGGHCTAGFVFGSNALRHFDHVSTAGHCVAFVGEAFYAGVPALNVLIHFGDASSEGASSDWALIDVLPAWEPFVDPDVALFGGPCGKVETTETPLEGTPVLHVGHPQYFFDMPEPFLPRAGAYESAAGAYAYFTGTANDGDSGGPILLVEAPEVGAPCAGASALGLMSGSAGDPDCDLHDRVCQQLRCNQGICRLRVTRVTEIPAELVYGNGLPA